MSRPNIEELRGLGDFATTYQWDVVFLEAAIFGFSEAMNQRCLTSELPKVINEPLDIKIRGHHIKQPGISDSSHTITLTFQETVDNTISNALLLWRTAIAEMISGQQQNVNAVKINILLNRMDRQDNVIWSYMLRGCFLEEYDPAGGELGADSGNVLPSLTISYDYFLEGPLGKLL